jgi:hypothetical protein
MVALAGETLVIVGAGLVTVSVVAVESAVAGGGVLTTMAIVPALVQ